MSSQSKGPQRRQFWDSSHSEFVQKRFDEFQREEDRDADLGWNHLADRNAIKRYLATLTDQENPAYGDQTPFHLKPVPENIFVNGFRRMASQFKDQLERQSRRRVQPQPSSQQVQQSDGDEYDSDEGEISCDLVF